MSREFKDVEYTKVQLSPGNINPAFDTSLEPDDEQEDGTKLINENEQPTNKKGPSFLSFEFYQQFFDVETSQVLKRLVCSMLPHPRINFLRNTLRPKADLYGPFWVSTTLIFTIAIAGNISNYLQFRGKHQWRYDFKKVTFAATAIYGYWWLVPILVWSLLKWKLNRLGYGFVEILAVFGYSLSIYIPISIFWVIQINWFQWLLVLCAMVLSGMVLFLTFLPAIREGDKKFGLIVMTIILTLHCALALGFMLYFFHVPSDSGSLSPASSFVPNVTTVRKAIKKVLLQTTVAPKRG